MTALIVSVLGTILVIIFIRTLFGEKPKRLERYPGELRIRESLNRLKNQQQINEKLKS
jgi:hypothetical protein